MSNSQTIQPRRWSWTLGNLLMFAGLYLLLYVGGVYADEAYLRAASRGDSTLPLPVAAVVETVPASAPEAFIAPNLNVASTAPLAGPGTTTNHSAVSRLVIPKINVDSKVVEVGWSMQDDVAVWQVAKFAVGHHQGSANPGEGDNIVLAGHVGGAGPVFADLIKLEPGDQVLLYSGGQEYLYVVRENLRVQEVGVPDEQRIKNAEYMHPTGSEVVTLITCWPPAGPNAFDQRVIIRAEPFQSAIQAEAASTSWTLQ